MEFNVNMAMYSLDMAHVEIARYIAVARKNMMLSFPGIRKICQEHFLPDCSVIIWQLENNRGNPVMDNFWAACAICRVSMTVVDLDATPKEVIVVPPVLTANYEIVRRQIGAVFASRRNSMQLNYQAVAQLCKTISRNTVAGVENGTRLTLRTFLALCKAYQLNIYLKQELL